jgi:antitoxin FitA
MMSTITITISDDRLLRLKELAKDANVAPEELVRASVEEWLSHPKNDFAEAAEYVLQKNEELYRRLA